MEKFAHELVPGDSYEPLEIIVEPALNQQIPVRAGRIRRTVRGGWGGGGTHDQPCSAASVSGRTRGRPASKLADGTGSVLAEAHTRFLRPAYVGERLRVSWRVTGAYEKRGRRYYVMETSMENGDGAVVLRRDLHLTFFGA